VTFAEGARFGQYRIESLLGRGGMGAVYVATDERLERRVALKLLSPELAAQATFRERFISESRTAASLDHPHIIPIYEAGEVEGQLFIAMRYVQGVDLDALLRREGALAPARSVRIVAQIGDALDAAHRAGLIHRDVKPGNILLGATSAGEDHAYLSDFGLTKQAAYGAGVTRTGQVVGTVDYVAPEQIEGHQIDRRVDIYSLGCVLFESLTGAPPFRRESEVAVLYAHVHSELPSAQSVRPELPEALDAVLAKAMAKDPELRFETAGDLGRAAAAALAGTRPAETGARGFLFADLRGYTDFVEREGDEAAADLLDRYRRMVREVVARSHGAEMRTEGDSFYVLFPSASRAVSAALEIVSEAVRRTADDPARPISVGVGVHAGETTETAEGPVGSAVNLAARICAEARAGEVLVSDTVRGLMRTRQVAAFEPVGSRRLKGIAEPVPLFRALAPGTAVAGGGRRTPTAPLTSLRTGEGPWRRFAAAGLGIGALAIVGVAFASGGLGGSAASPSPSAGASSGASGAVASSAVVPTGTRIVYSRQLVAETCDEGPADAKLYVLDPDDPRSAPYRLTERSNLAELDPAWSADGSRLAFVASVLRGPGGLASVGPSGEPVQVHLASREAPSIDPFAPTDLTTAPDGSAIVHAGEDQMWRTTLDGSAIVQIGGVTAPDEPDTEPAAPTEFYRDVAYRSDGSLLVLFGPVEEGPPWLETMADDGTGRTRLDLDLSDLQASRIALAPDDDLLSLEIDSEDGPAIAIGRIADGPSSFRELDLGLESPQQAQFSPDGASLVLQAGGPGEYELFMVELETGTLTQLTDDPDAIACTPAWRAAPADLAQARPEPGPDDIRWFELGRLEAGTYLNDTLKPPIELTFDDGWFARRNYVDGWSVFKPAGPPGEVDHGRIQVGHVDACGEAETVLIGPRPDDLITHLQARADLEVSAADPINLGGYPGLTVEVRGLAGQGCQPDPEDPTFEFWALFPTGEDSFSLGPTEGLRLASLDVGGAAFSFLVFSDIQDLATYWRDEARPVLETARFPGA
jgi:serine/threonine-protein kinase